MLIKTKVTKMTNAEAHKVSLVKRAASRIAFRVVKSDKNTEESGMFNLARVFKQEDMTPAAPEAVAVVVQKADASEELKVKLGEAGFEVGDTVENEDGTVSYVRKGEDLEGDVDVIRQSDDVLVIMKGFRPYTSDLTEFSEMAQAQGFYSGVRTASDILAQAINNALDDATSPSNASSAIGTVVDAYRKYVVAMASALPQVAFKAEKVVADDKADKAKAAAAVVVSTEVANPEAKVVKTEGEPAAPVVEAAKVDEPVATTTVVEAAAAPAEGAGAELKEILKTELDKFVQSLDSVRNEMAEVRKTQETLQNSVQEAVTKSEQIAQKVNGTLVATPPGEDQPSGTKVVKTEEFEPLGDTAFTARGNKYR